MVTTILLMTIKPLILLFLTKIKLKGWLLVFYLISKTKLFIRNFFFNLRLKIFFLIILKITSTRY